MDKPLIVDLAQAKTAADLHTILAKALNFPDYYGKNWVAFNDVVMAPKGHGVVLPHQAFFTSWWDLSESLPREAELFTRCVRSLINSFDVEWQFVHEVVSRQPRDGDAARTIHSCLREDCSRRRDPETGVPRWTLLVCGHGYWPCWTCRYPVHPTVACPHGVLDDLALV